MSQNKKSYASYILMGVIATIALFILFSQLRSASLVPMLLDLLSLMLLIIALLALPKGDLPKALNRLSLMQPPSRSRPDGGRSRQTSSGNSSRQQQVTKPRTKQ